MTELVVAAVAILLGAWAAALAVSSAAELKTLEQTNADLERRIRDLERDAAGAPDAGV